MTIYLIRHGLTQANVERRYYGTTDLPLCDEGVEQLRRMKAERDLPAADCYATSTLCRAVETLAVLFGREPDVRIAELNEFDFGDFEMKTHDQLQDHLDYQNWINGDAKAACPNGESWETFFDRVRRGWQKLVETSDDSIALISHGGVIACLMTTLFPGGKDNYYEWLPDHGRGYAVEYSGGPLAWREF